jgi:hypothetical protein
MACNWDTKMNGGFHILQSSVWRGPLNKHTKSKHIFQSHSLRFCIFNCPWCSFIADTELNTLEIQCTARNYISLYFFKNYHIENCFKQKLFPRRWPLLHHPYFPSYCFTVDSILVPHRWCLHLMYVCMYKGWAFSALAPRPTVVYCASPFFDYPFSNPALRM